MSFFWSRGGEYPSTRISAYRSYKQILLQLFDCFHKRTKETIPHLSILRTELVYDPRLSEEVVEHLQKINTLEELMEIRIIEDPSHPYHKLATSFTFHHTHLPLNLLSPEN